MEVQAPAADVFRYWSNFEGFPAFISNVEEVRMTGTDTSHWKVKGPLGKSVRFEEVAPDRTRIDVTMDYSDPPGGGGEAVANVFSNPERNLREDLQNFAKIVERGELGGPESQTPSRRTARRTMG